MPRAAHLPRTRSQEATAAELGDLGLRFFWRGRVVRSHPLGESEVDELDSGVPHPPDVPLVGGAVLAVPVLAHEQNVFRLQVSVSQMVFVEKLRTDLELIINHNCIVWPH